MHVEVDWERIFEDVPSDDFDSVGEGAFGDGAFGDLIDGRFFENGGAKVWKVRDEGTGVNAGASANVEQGGALREVDGFGGGLAEIDAAAIHGRGKIVGEGYIFHRFGPRV